LEESKIDEDDEEDDDELEEKGMTRRLVIVKGEIAGDAGLEELAKGIKTGNPDSAGVDT
jgi:hypothetical protein